MDNEIKEMFSILINRIDDMSRENKEIRNEINEIRAENKEIRNDIRIINLRIDNEINKNIATIAEVVSDNNNRLSAIESDITEIKDNQAIAGVLSELAHAIKRD